MESASVLSAAASGPVLQPALAAALRDEPQVVDCAVVVRSASTADCALVAYIVTGGPLDLAALRGRLQPLLDRHGPAELHLVPLLKLPLTPDGSADLGALARIPVIDEQALRAGERALEQLPGVQSAAVIGVPAPLAEAPPYHQDDLLPAVRAPAAAPVSEAQAAPAPAAPPAPDPAAEARAPALVQGPDLAAVGGVPHANLLDLLRAAVARNGERPIRFVGADGRATASSYAQLWAAAERIHGGLVANGLKPGDKVVCQLRDNRDLLATFWACQMGGLVPAIVEVPTHFREGNQAFDRVIGLVRALDHPPIVADDTVAGAFAHLEPATPGEGLRMRSVEELKSCAPLRTCHTAEPDAIALFNLSSGSTGVPKCIMLSHRSLIARAHGANRLCGFSSDDTILSWLPFDHIGSISDWHLRCVLLGCELIYAEKDYVLGQPLRWLDLIDRYRVTHSWAPNFAFALIDRELTLAPAPSWDLSCVRGLLTAGEAVSGETVERFLKSLARFGLRSTAILPAFGMAELGSGIAYFVASEREPVRFHSIAKPALGERIRRVPPDHPDASRFADLGPPIPGVSLRIVDAEGATLPMETVGRLQVGGAPVFKGYYNRPDANAAAFAPDGWLDTGDLGFLTDGHLVLAGREKETIVVKGANYYCHEIEETAAQVPGLVPSFTAACGVRRATDSEERLAVFFVADSAADEADLIGAVRARIASRFGIGPTYLIPVERERIPKTPIGKIQRNRLKALAEAGEFDAIVKRSDLLLGNRNTLPAWFFERIWVPRRLADDACPALPETGQTAALPAGTLLVVPDAGGPANALAQALCEGAADCAVLRLASGERAAGAPESDPASRLGRILAERRGAGTPIAQILCLVDFTAEPAEAGDGGVCPDNLRAFLEVVRGVLRAQGGSGAAVKRLIWAASGAHAIGPGEPGSPNKATIEPLLGTLHGEHPDIDCRHIDLPRAEPAEVVEHLRAELASASREAVVAYRGGVRLVPRLARQDLLAERGAPFELRRGGHYLVTGGLGDIGMELCRTLGRLYGARLAIVGRTPLAGDPAGSGPAAEHPAEHRAQRLRRLSNEGIDCTYAALDVADPAALADFVARSESDRGRPLDGIFHLAGTARECALAEETAEGFAALARPKTAGTAALAALLDTRPEAFLVAFSSVNARFGGAGAGAYSAANACLDALCRRLHRRGARVACYDWSRWEGLGMGAGSGLQAAAAARGFRGIPPGDGIRSLLALLAAGRSASLVGLDATRPAIRSLLADDCFAQHAAVGFVEAQGPGQPAQLPKSVALVDRFDAPFACPIETVAALPRTPEGAIDRQALARLAQRGQKANRAPETDIESELVRIWRELLEVADLGTQDSFFELGGDSLLAIRLVARIERTFRTRLPVSAVFHAPTIEQLALAVARSDWTSDRFSLVPIRPEGSRPPLFVVQSTTWDMIRHLDPDQPVYGLHYGVGAKSAEERLALPDRLEDLASHYVAEIRRLRSEGPYYLIGHSGAGLVAYEMARQLAEQGQALGLVGLIDTLLMSHTPGHRPGSPREKLALALKLSPKELLALSLRSLTHRLDRLKTAVLRRHAEQPLALRARKLYFAYRPGPYPGRVSYWKCTVPFRLEPIPDDERKWEQLALGGVELHPMQCRHYEIMREPHIRILAKDIEGYLERGRTHSARPAASAGASASARTAKCVQTEQS